MRKFISRALIALGLTLGAFAGTATISTLAQGPIIVNPAACGTLASNCLVIAGNSITLRTLGIRFGERINVLDGYAGVAGARGATLVGGEIACTNGSTTIEVESAQFTPDDVGKMIFVTDCATGPTTLVSTITGYIDATHVTLADPATRTFANAIKRVVYGYDDSVAISNITAAVRARNGTNTVSSRSMEVYYPPIVYIVRAVPVDWTNLQQTTIAADGATFYCATNGAPCFDAYGFYDGAMRGFSVIGDRALPPSWGLQVGRYETGGAYGTSDYHGLNFTGYFSRGVWYNNCSEVQNFFGGTFESKTANTTVFVGDGSSNHTLWPAPSTYVNVTIGDGVVCSNSQNSFYTTRFVNDAADSVAMWFSNTKGWDCFNCYWVSTKYGLVIYSRTLPVLATGGQGPFNFQGTFDGPPLVNVFVDRDSAARILGLKLLTHGSPPAGSTIFGTTSLPATTVTISGAEITYTDLTAGAPAATLFDRVGEWAVYGDITGTYVRQAAPVLPTTFVGKFAENGAHAQLYNNAVKAANSTTWRSLEARLAEHVNVKDFGASGDGTTDDSVAFIEAMTLANTKAAAGTPINVYAPAGIYRLVSTLPIFVRNGGIVGDGPNKTWIKLDTSYVGNVFSWTEAWMSSQYPAQTGTVDIANQKAGPYAEGFSIVGITTSAANQNAFVFYDRNDQVLVKDINIFNLNGRAIYAGVALNTTEGYMRESVFQNIRMFTVGNSSVPVVEFNSVTISGAAVDATDEIIIDNMSIFAPLGRGMVIRGQGVSSVRNFHIDGLRIEGIASPSPAITGDLLTIGDTVLTGTVNNVYIRGLELIAPYSGYAAIRTTAPSAGTRPYAIEMQGFIGPGAGTGINVDAGRNMRFRMGDVGTTGTQVTVGSSTLVGSNIEFDGGGAETAWTYSIDSTSVNSVRRPAPSYGNPSQTSFAIGSGATANARGQYAFDGQYNRFAATQVASGASSVVGGGEGNTASNTHSTVSGGGVNTASGFRATVPGGYGNTASGLYSVAMGLQSTAANHGQVAVSAGQFSAAGDAQAGLQVLRGTGASTTAFRLTADGAAASGVNCLNLAANQGMAIVVTIMAWDVTTVTRNEAWHSWAGLLTRGASAASTTLTMAATPTPLTNGTVTGSAIAATADTTLGCLNLSFTPPTANTDTWRVVARVESVEVK